jgi:hypothetical protein
LLLIYTVAATVPHAPEGRVLDVLEVAGCAFMGFLYIAILATAVTRKTRPRSTRPAHPEGATLRRGERVHPPKPA